MNFETISKAQLRVAKQGISTHSGMSSSFGGYGMIQAFRHTEQGCVMFTYDKQHQIDLLAHHGFMPVHSHYQPVMGPKNA